MEPDSLRQGASQLIQDKHGWSLAFHCFCSASATANRTFFAEKI
jgi:hypothetical protein